MGVKPVFESGFEIPEEGTYELQIKDITFDHGEKGLSCKIKSEIVGGEHAECIGMGVFDNFPLYTAFGLARLLGLGVKAIGMPADKEYPETYFNDDKSQARFTGKAKDVIFGGEIKIAEGKKGKMANIKKVFSKDEVKALLKTKTTTGAPANPAAETPPAETTTKDEW